MIQYKKILMTLVALLLTAVCGAWAQSSLNVVELEVPAAWANDNSNMTAADLPGFKAVTVEEGQAWTGAPAEGVAYLFYDFDGADVKYISFEKGKYTGYAVQPLPKNVIFGAKFYYTTGPASSGTAVEVDWNKTSNTGTFTQPGGNVELEPEYFPQATMVADAVTAVAGVKATTDDPLVTLDKSKLIGASGMMYYVGTTDTKPAYNAEGWTSEVPTAADITMAKTVYVWYYPVGADSDNPAKTYSDGEMNINALQVAVADPPTYAITLAEGTEDVGEWIISQVEGLLGGETVTATYNGTKKVKSVKAVKKADNAYLKWDADQKKLVATEFPTTANKVQNVDKNIEWAGTYVVEDDVTINGEIKLTGDVELIIKDGAKLTVNKIIHTQSGASLSVYGQTQMSGELNVTNQGSDAIFGLYSLAVHSCKVKATSPAGDGGGVYNTTTLNVYGGSLDAEYTGEGSGHGIILKAGGSMNIYGGEVKAVGKGNHADYSYGIKSSSSKSVANVKVYGGKLWAECAGNKAFRQINLTTEAGFTGKIETSSNGSSWTDWTTEGTPNTKYVKVE